AGPPEADPAEARPAESGPSPSRGPAGLGPSLSRGPEPKYKNSPETPIYSKRRVLYGLHWAKAAVAETGEVVVCEGYTDVIAFFQAGLPRAVATCGTALAEDHFGLLRNFARRVVLAYDSDRAGQAAAERVYEWERRHELDIAVAALPPGTDPADLGQRDPEALRAAVEEAKPFLSFRVERVLGGADLSTAERRARAAEAALAVIAEHPNVLVRDQYVMEVAARCRLEADRLRPLLGRLRGGGAGRAGAGGAQAGGVGRPAGEGDRDRDPDRLGLECLRLAIHRPAEVADRLEEVLFRDPVQRAAFRALAGSATLHDAIAGAEPPAAGLLRRLAVEESEADPKVEVPRLVGAAARRALGGLEADVRAAPERAAELAPVTTWLGVEINALSEPELGLEAAARLLAWLVEWAEEE
ncbi:MAG: toprim domain-containing protein, partial [Acidimicrobiales bacterium]